MPNRIPNLSENRFIRKCAVGKFTGANITCIYSETSGTRTSRRAMQIQPTEFILSDNGSEFMANFDNCLKNHRTTHFWTYPKSPKMNAHNERFNRNPGKLHRLSRTPAVLRPAAFNQKMAEWPIDYNTKIPHYSLSLRSPIQYLIQQQPECQMWWIYTPCFNPFGNLLSLSTAQVRAAFHKATPYMD